MTITVKVAPRAKLNKIEQTDIFEYRVWLTATPEKNRANQALIKLLADHFNIPPYQIIIKAGHHHKSKIIELVGI